MVIREEINGKIFIEQRTYYIYASEEDLQNNKPTLSTSDENSFIANKEATNEGEEKTIILV